MSKYDYMTYNDLLGQFKTGREFLDWIIEGDWSGQLGSGMFEMYFESLKQAVNQFSYDVPIPEEEMCEALERTMRTGEVIIAEADPENIEEGKLDGWTYHLRFVKPEEYFNVETPPSPPEYLDHD